MIEGPGQVAAALHEDLDRLADLDPRMLTGGQVEELERQVFAAKTRLDELAARLVPQAEALDLAKEAGKTSTTAWLGQVAGVSRREASRTVKAGRLVEGLDATRAAWAAGSVSTEKVLVIAGAIDALPWWANGHDERRDAERTLLGFAGEFGVRDLKRLANTIIEVIDPDGADEIIGKKLAEQEKRAWDRTRLRISDLGSGASKVAAVIPTAQAAPPLAALAGGAPSSAPRSKPWPHPGGTTCVRPRRASSQPCRTSRGSESRSVS